ncbi:MAG: hypothetical protein JWP47_370 [Polaromonas sp.]|jgi:hypothetical protein|nr:hypothetical protein [Polaromonas sp.]
MTHASLMQPLRFLPSIARLSIGVIMLALLAACASPITTKVTRFNAWPADAAGSTFSFVTPADRQNSLEQTTYESYVAAELQKIGLQPAPSGQAGRIQVSVVTGNRTEERKFRQPVYQDSYVFQPPYRDAAGRIYPGYWAPDLFGPRYVGDREVSQQVSVSNLRLRLLDTRQSPPGKPRTVFESRAVYEGFREELPGLVPLLVRAVFEDFPGQNGSVRLVRFDAETGAVVKE